MTSLAQPPSDAVARGSIPIEASLVEPTAAGTTAKLQGPFPGPLPFLQSDEPIFCGRERETSDLLDMLLSYGSVVLYSQSGAGKTSIVNAGIGPALQRKGFRVVRARVIGEASAPEGVTIPNRFVWNVLKSCLDASVPDRELAGFTIEDGLRMSNSPTLLIVDQLEELFLPIQDGARLRREFFTQLKRAFDKIRKDAEVDLLVLYVIREDYFPRLDRYAGAIPHACNIRYRLDRLSKAEAKQAISQPLERFGYHLVQGALDSLIENLQTMRGANGASITTELIEPLELQIVCDQLWQKVNKREKTITAADVSNFADVYEAARSYYEQTIARAARQTGCAEAKLRSWCEGALITATGARNLILAGERETAGMPNHVVESLVQDRLIHKEVRPSGALYELSHDRFVDAVKRSNADRERKLDRLLLKAGKIGVPVLVVALVLLGLLAWHQREGAKEQEHKARVAALQAAEDASKIQKVALQGKLNEAQNNLNTINLQKHLLDSTIQQQKDLITAAKSKLDELNELNQSNRAEFKKRDKEVRTLTEQIRKAAEQVQKANLSQAALEIARQVQANQFEQTSSELTNTKSQLATSKEAAEHANALLALERQDFGAELETCHRQLTDAKRDLEQTVKSQTACASDSESLRKQIADQNQTNTSCERQKDSLEQALAVACDRLAACPSCGPLPDACPH